MSKEKERVSVSLKLPKDIHIRHRMKAMSEGKTLQVYYEELLTEHAPRPR